jgi:YebC/PmpR family DNA-binding regulatory protein
MSGHSKWANIKARKGSQDAKRGNMFTKIAKEIIIAARLGGGDPDGNPRLRAAMQAGRAINMPNDNIKRAIARGTGAEGETQIEEVIYEGFGPNGVAILVEGTTDNRNRTTGEIRHTFSKYGGNLGVQGCVARMFTRQGLVIVQGEGITEEKVFEAAIEAGADDMEREDDAFYIYTKFEDLHPVNEALSKAGLPVTSVKAIYSPTMTTRLAADQGRGLLKLIDTLEDNDDVQNVWANFDMDEKDMEDFEG